ncbi:MULTISPECIES: TRAM domain-containing protein [Halobacterium]|uniref:TRAM domain-containing protein n=1 Tax=Halobacterium TaxID=2239 RepID=UPI00073F4DBD|nr:MULTISPECIES: TRAM domain-containing protein [Halobacterium]MCG1002979.1 TRAM domain-containing protein [Halobacterium noricense]
MSEIPDSLRLLYETTLEERDGQYVVSIPTEVVEDSTLTPEDVYRVALLNSPADAATESEPSSDTSRASPAPSQTHDAQSPPVEEGEIRTVTIDTLGDQGDGIAKVERGFIVIVPGTQPGDKAEVEITDVKSSVAFAEPVSEPEVR